MSPNEFPLPAELQHSQNIFETNRSKSTIQLMIDSVSDNLKEALTLESSDVIKTISKFVHKNRKAMISLSVFLLTSCSEMPAQNQDKHVSTAHSYEEPSNGSCYNKSERKGIIRDSIQNIYNEYLQKWSEI